MSVFIYSYALVAGALTVFSLYSMELKVLEKCLRGLLGESGELNRWALDHPHLLMHLNQSVPALFFSVSGFVRGKGSLAIQCF